MYAIYYASPVFMLDDYVFRNHGTEEGMTASLWIALVGACLLLVTFYNLPHRIGGLLPQFRADLQPSRARILAIIVGLVGLFVTWNVDYQSSLSFAAMRDFISRWSILGIAVLYVLHLRGQLKLTTKLFLGGILLPLVLVMDLGTGLLSFAMRDLLVLFFIYWKVRGRPPMKAIILLVLIFAPLVAVKEQFRDTAWYGAHADDTAIEKGLIYLRLGNTQVMENSEDAYRNSLDRTSKRVAALQTLAFVVEDTPEIVPYWNGETYTTIFTGFIPRFLWPDKPQKTLGQDFGHRYNILDDHDFATSWNFPQLVELYANFGWLGIILGMPFIGLLYRVLYNVFNHPNSGDGGAVISAIIFTGLMNIESDFSLVFGGLIQVCILYIIMLRSMGRSNVGKPGIARRRNP
ncbi:MAG: hypothetical protein ACR2H4_20540 [Pyrinomonadaceae bacterium]